MNIITIRAFVELVGKPRNLANSECDLIRRGYSKKSVTIRVEAFSGTSTPHFEAENFLGNLDGPQFFKCTFERFSLSGYVGLTGGDLFFGEIFPIFSHFFFRS